MQLEHPVLDIEHELRVEIAVRGLDLNRPEDCNECSQVLSRLVRERAEGELHLLDAAHRWLDAHPRPTHEDMFRLFGEPDVVRGLELAYQKWKELKQ